MTNGMMEAPWCYHGTSASNLPRGRWSARVWIGLGPREHNTSSLQPLCFLSSSERQIRVFPFSIAEHAAENKSRHHLDAFAETQFRWYS